MGNWIIVLGAAVAGLILTKRDESQTQAPSKTYVPPPMPQQPPLPAGFKRWPWQRKVTGIASSLAGSALNSLPIGGMQTATDSDGTTIAAFKEYHLDDHVKNPDGSGLPWWHPGISLLVKS